MIVLNILSFGRYLLLKRFWSRTLLVLQLHCEKIVCLETDCISQLFYISLLLDHVLSVMHLTFIFVKYKILMDKKIFKICKIPLMDAINLKDADFQSNIT